MKVQLSALCTLKIPSWNMMAFTPSLSLSRAQKFFGLYRHGEFQKDNGAVKLTEQKKEPKTVVSDTFNP